MAKKVKAVARQVVLCPLCGHEMAYSHMTGVWNCYATMTAAGIGYCPQFANSGIVPEHGKVIATQPTASCVIHLSSNVVHIRVVGSPTDGEWHKCS